MIRDIFIPNRIGSYYLFPQRIVGIDIQPHAIYATVLYLYKRIIAIEKQLSRPVAENSAPEQTAQVLKELFESIGSYDYVATVLPSSYAVFKTITLPFTNKEKIGMVIGYELEPGLPFALSDAAIGFITTAVDEQEQSTEVVAVAIKKEYLQAHKTIFELAGITPELVSIDSLVNFEIIKSTATFKQRSSQPVALINIKDAETEVSYILNGALKLIRTLPTGMYDILKGVAQKTGSSIAKVKTLIDQYGVLNNPDHTFDAAIKESCNSLIQSIAFTCNTFSQRVNFPPIQSSLLVGAATQLKEMETLISQKLSTPCTSIPTAELMGAQDVSLKPSQEYLSSFAVAHAFANARNANIATQESTQRDLSLVTKQIITVGILSLLLVATVGVSTFMQLRHWNAEYNSSLEQAIQELKSIPGATAAPGQEEEGEAPSESLESYIARAKTLVAQRKNLVDQFSPAHKRSMLEYLLELSKLDRDELGLNMERLTLTPQKMVIKGRVKGPNEIAIVRNVIEGSHLFGQYTPSHGLSNPEFSATITLTSKRP